MDHVHNEKGLDCEELDPTFMNDATWYGVPGHTLSRQDGGGTVAVQKEKEKTILCVKQAGPGRTTNTMETYGSGPEEKG
jgi:hypothetical protein